MTPGIALGLLGSLAVAAALITLMIVGWRGRRRRQAELPGLPAAPAELGAVLRLEDVFYVATTRAAAPLDRIAVHGLGFRARAVLTIAEHGVRLEIAGRREPLVLPRAALVGAGRASWTIDRGVGGSRLVFVRWRLGDVEVDTNLRPSDPAATLEALTNVAPAVETGAVA